MADSLLGLDVIVRPDHPKRQLPEDVPCTAAYRAEFNAWLAEFFGMENWIPDGQAIQAGPRIFVNPRTFAALKKLPQFRPADPLAMHMLHGNAGRLDTDYVQQLDGELYRRLQPKRGQRR